MAKELSSETDLPEQVTLYGDEYIPILKSDGTPARTRLSAVTPHTDHRKVRPFKGRVPVYPLAGVLDTMTGTGTYTLTPASGGSVTRTDSSEAYYGTKIVTVVTGNGGPGLYSIVRRNDIGRTINCTDKWIGIDLDSPDPTKIDEIQFYLGNTNLSAFYRWNNLLGGQSVRPMQFGTRTRITFPVAVSSLGSLGHASSVTGSPDLAVINAWQIRIADKAGGACTVKVDRVFVFDKPPPTIVVTFDDGYETVYSQAKPVMDEYGIRSTIFAIREYHDDTIPGFSQSASRLTRDQLRRFIEGGHELGFHMTGNHAGQDFSPAAVDAECVAFKKWARSAFGVDVMSAAYPGGEQGYFSFTGQDGWVSGDETKTVREIFAKHFPFCRTIARVSPESDPPADNSLLKCFMYQYGSGGSYTSPAINQGYVNTVVSKGGVAISSYHDITSGASTKTTEYSVADFTANMQYIRSAGINPLTVREAFTQSL